MKKYLLLALLLLPVVAFAQPSAVKNNPLAILVEVIISYINDLFVPLLFAIAFAVFLWGVFNYFIAGAADEEKRSDGKKFVTWGMIGFFIMISLWGLVNLLVNTFDFDGQQRPDLPTFRSPSGSGTTQGNTNPGTTQGNTNPGTTQGNTNPGGRLQLGASCVATIQCGSGLICLDGTCERAN